MANSIKVLFWLRKNKANKEGLVPLQIRITFQGVRVDKATGHYVHPLQWNSQKQRLKGSKGVTDDINKMLDDLMAKISVVSRGEDNSSNIHLPSIMEQLFATSTEEPTLLGLINEHNIKLKERVGKDVAFSTYEKYIFTYKKVKAFVEQSLGKKDILLRNLNMKFIMDFDHFIRVHDNNQHNTAVKYCINLKRIIN
ncbi:MAG: phage integrase SAM-like domain-containing protein, partial [Ferruginibacter sp.]